MSSASRWASVCAVAVSACTPALDWREVRPEGVRATALFPCKPQHHRRSVTVREAALPMQLVACSAAGRSFGVAYVDVASSSEVDAALVAMAASANANLTQADIKSSPLSIPGMTPNAKAALISSRGVASTGAQVQLDVGVFAKGLRVYQATAFGANLERDVADTFFSGIRLQ